MASKKSVKSKTKSRAKKPAAKRRQEPASGDHARMLPGKNTVLNFIKEIRACKSRTSTIGQEVTEATKQAKEAGVDVPAARIAERIYGKALNDAIKGRVLWENVQFYLLECTDFEKIAPAGMFDPAEVRSTKQSSKKNGRSRKQQPEQTDIENVITGSPQEQTEVSADEREPETVVH